MPKKSMVKKTTKKPVKKTVKKPVAKKLVISTVKKKVVKKDHLPLGSVQPHVKFSFARLLLLLTNVLGGIIFITLLIVYVYVGIIYDNNTKEQIAESLALQDSSDVELKRTYQDSIIDIQQKYLFDIKSDLVITDNPDIKKKYYQDKEKNLDSMLDDLYVLKVPSVWKELHMDLFSSYTYLLQANNSMLDIVNEGNQSGEKVLEYQINYQEYLEKAQDKIEALNKLYSWIKIF